MTDAVTGLVHFSYRDYDPATGRFTVRDPLLFGGGQGNLYAYVGSDPVGSRDPSGLADPAASPQFHQGVSDGAQAVGEFAGGKIVDAVKSQAKDAVKSQLNESTRQTVETIEAAQSKADELRSKGRQESDSEYRELAEKQRDAAKQNASTLTSPITSIWDRVINAICGGDSNPPKQQPEQQKKQPERQQAPPVSPPSEFGPSKSGPKLQEFQWSPK